MESTIETVRTEAERRTRNLYAQAHACVEVLEQYTTPERVVSDGENPRLEKACELMALSLGGDGSLSKLALEEDIRPLLTGKAYADLVELFTVDYRAMQYGAFALGVAWGRREKQGAR